MTIWVPDNPLLYVPSHASREFLKDLEAAKIPKNFPGVGKADFHALRTTYTTLVIESGANGVVPNAYRSSIIVSYLVIQYPFVYVLSMTEGSDSLANRFRHDVEPPLRDLCESPTSRGIQDTVSLRAPDN
ncbi:MAG TPA: hypothetical protein PL033_16730 [Candidatus Brocadiia bacterium]|nr:hypothetical protein [Candidatus Brocadiia bacterium]